MALPRLSFPTLICTLLVTANAYAATWIKLRHIKEQTVDTPVPIFVKVHHKPRNASVVLYFHAAGQEDWSRRTMDPTHQGFGAMIPCEAVQNEAIVEFYVQVEKNGRPVAHSGSKHSPHAVAFVENLKGRAPSLPGEDPPEKCEEATKVVLASSPPEEEKHPEHTEAPENENHHEETRRVWANLGIVQDLALVGGKDVCSQAGEKNAFYCFRADGKQYLGFPVIGDHDEINTGFALSATRVVAGLDYVLGAAAIGARLGFTVHGSSPAIQGGKTSLPVLASARVEYWFADHAYSTKGFSAYLFAEAGMAEADASRSVVIVEDTTKKSVQTDNPPIQDAVAWKRMGLGYGGIGLGGFVPVSSSGGVLIEVQGRYMFPASGFVVAPGAAYALGF